MQRANKVSGNKASGICSFPGKKEMDEKARMDRCQVEKDGDITFMKDKRLTPKSEVAKTKTSCDACSAFCVWVPANEADDGCCVNKFRFIRNKKVSFDEKTDHFNKHHLCNDPDFVKQCASLDISMWDENKIKGWTCLDNWKEGCYEKDASYDASKADTYRAVQKEVRESENLQNLKKLTDEWKIDEIDLTSASETKKIDECESKPLSPEEEADKQAKEAAKKAKAEKQMTMVENQNECVRSGNLKIFGSKSSYNRIENYCKDCAKKCKWLPTEHGGCCVGVEPAKNKICGDDYELTTCK